ncbi:MAG TPA: 6-pyruvoyl-tetrahydropterin synthase-related protein [Blastocatellia bacterium]|nr:6-pyruvoyl-tetrahydropterin synthase-related protein [Blastocatellia bacterium]
MRTEAQINNAALQGESSGDKKQRRKRRAIYAAIALLIGTGAVAPFYLSRREKSPETGEVYKLFVTHDLVMHLPQAQEFDRVLRSGVIYPRWLPNVNHGYGVVTMNFYPPGQFYLMSLFNAIFGDWVNGLFALSALGLAGSGLAFYLFARLFLGRAGSGAAAILYMLLPFHTLNLYWQGAIPQFLGYVFIPLVMYFAYKSGREGKLRHVAALGLIYGLYLLTHLPVSYLFTYIVALYAAVWAISARDWKIGLRIAAGMALGLLLSAIYWLPAALESKYIYEWASELLPYHRTYFTLPLPTDYFTILLNVVFAIQLLTLITGLVILAPTAFKGRPVHDRMDREATRQVRIWMLMGVLTTLFNTSPASLILRFVPKIQVATPAWRWLVIAGFFACLLIAAAIEKLRAAGRKPSWSVSLGRAVVVMVFVITVFFSARFIVYEALSSPTYKPPAVYVDSGFTPRGAPPPELLPDVPLVRLEPGGGVAEIKRWDAQNREVHVSSEKSGFLRLKTYNYPGWVARIDGKPVEIKTDLHGSQLIDMPSGDHNVEVAFVNTMPRTAGTIISGLALVAIVGLGLARDVRTGIGGRVVAGPGEPLEPGGIGEISTASPRVTGSPQSEPAVAPTRLLRSKGRLKAISGRWLALTLAGLVGVSVVAISFLPGRGAGPAAVKPPAQDLKGAARISIAGYNRLTIASDEEAFDELIRALSSRNDPKVQSLIEAGRAFTIENEVRVKALGSSGSKIRVLILEGDHADTEAWVLDRWIKNP